MKKTLVISAVSIRSGGMLSILVDCLKELSSPSYSGYDIIILIKDPALVSGIGSNFKFISIDGTRGYLFRLYTEFFTFYKLSTEIKPVLWLSLHDITPRLNRTRQAVYCHNATPFYDISWREFRLEPKFGFFNFFYTWLYRINIHKNDFVIVQQHWLREKFTKRFGLRNEKIIVARPETQYTLAKAPKQHNEVKCFIFPSVPRVWKNFEVVCEAARILENKGITNFEVLITVKGDECKYAKFLAGEYGTVKNLKFIGNQSREKLFELYNLSDCLIFPSKLESWGLPISEFKHFGKILLLANLPYTRETVGDYSNVSFFNPTSPIELSRLMENIINGKFTAQGSRMEPIAQPFVANWKDLFAMLLK